MDNNREQVCQSAAVTATSPQLRTACEAVRLTSKLPLKAFDDQMLLKQKLPEQVPDQIGADPPPGRSSWDRFPFKSVTPSLGLFMIQTHLLLLFPRFNLHMQPVKPFHPGK